MVRRGISGGGSEGVETQLVKRRVGKVTTTVYVTHTVLGILLLVATRRPIQYPRHRPGRERREASRVSRSPGPDFHTFNAEYIFTYKYINIVS